MCYNHHYERAMSEGADFHGRIPDAARWDLSTGSHFF
jgi:hypothetical protein